jgi:hypothetical protein
MGQSNLTSLVFLPIVVFLLKEYLKSIGATKNYTNKYKERDYIAAFSAVVASLALTLYMHYGLQYLLDRMNNIENLEYFIYFIMFFPYLFVGLYMYYVNKLNLNPNRGYFFIYIVIVIHFTAAGFLNILNNTTLIKTLDSGKIIATSAMFFSFTIISCGLMMKAFSNELVTCKYIVRYENENPIISNKIVENGSNILVYLDDNSLSSTMLEIHKSNVKSISIIKYKKKLYGAKES